MADAKLVEYIKASRLSGRTDSEIKKTLADIGWTAAPIEDALQEANTQTHLSSSEKPAPTLPNEDSTTSQNTANSSRGRLILLLTTVVLLLAFAVVGGFIALRNVPFPGSTTQTSTSRDQDRKSDIKSYAQALSKYYDSHNRYPTVSGSNGLDSTNSSLLGVFDSSGVLKGIASTFPKDPKNGESLCRVNASTKQIPCAYKYRVSSDGKKFIIWAVLENSYNNEGVYSVDSDNHHALVSTEPTNP